MHFTAHQHLIAQPNIQSTAGAAGTFTGSNFDAKEVEELLILVNVGVGAANSDISGQLQHSDTGGGGTFTAVAGGYLDDTFTGAGTGNALDADTAEGNKTYLFSVNTTKLKRYLRYQTVVATAACPHSVVFIGCSARTLPVTQIGTLISRIDPRDVA